MTHTYSQEFEISCNGKEPTTLEISVDVQMKSSGSPGSGPTLSGPGEPPEPPEFEAGNAYVSAGGRLHHMVDDLLALIIGQTELDAFYEAAVESAAEAEPSEYDSYDDYDPREDDYM